MTTRRKLEIGPDGMADVMILTEPIPRHLSVVNWGANNRPAESWKSAEMTETSKSTLREFPAEVLRMDGFNMERVQGFLSETLDAFSTVAADILSKPLTAAERSAQIRAIASQAGARVAAFAFAAGPAVKAIAKTYKTVGLKPPAPQENSTLQAELDRRQFMSAVEQYNASITDEVLSVIRDASTPSSATESILSLFGDMGSLFSKWAAALPDGVVGVKQTAPEETKNAGARHSKGDKAKLKAALDAISALLDGDDENQPTSTENSAMNISIKDLQALAEENPVGLVHAIKTAFEQAAKMAPETTKKFSWGDTGVEQHDPSAIINELIGFQGGEAIGRVIAGAVAGIDVGSMAERDNVQVASTMRSGIVAHCAAEIKANPKGELAEALKTAMAEDIGEAVEASLKALLEGMTPDDGGTDSAPGAFGLGGLRPAPTEKSESDPFKVVYPGQG